MIVSFGSRDTERVWNGEQIKGLPYEIQHVARRKLKDYYSIRINDQWRVIFKWDDKQAKEVEIVDYH